MSPDREKDDARFVALEAAVKALRDAAARGPFDAVKDLQLRVERGADALALLRGEFAAFAESAKEGKAKFDKIDRKLRELSVRQEISGEAAAANSKGLERLEDGLAALNAREGMSSRKLKEALGRLSGLEEKIVYVDKLKADISGLRETLGRSSVSTEEFRFCMRKMGVIEAAFAEFSGKISQQESDHASAVSSIEDLENRLEYLSVILNRIREMAGKTKPSSLK